MSEKLVKERQSEVTEKQKRIYGVCFSVNVKWCGMEKLLRGLICENKCMIRLEIVCEKEITGFES